MHLALVLIARNEARGLARCLTSAAPYVDRMLVLDTGSTDDTADIAAACGARVHHFAWQNDFSAARNRALELADADWSLVLDADEWIESGGECLRDWTAGAPPRLGVVCIHSDFDTSGPDGPGRNRSWMTRLLPRGTYRATSTRSRRFRAR